jgi:4-hydroxymandelate oxidase
LKELAPAARSVADYEVQARQSLPAEDFEFLFGAPRDPNWTTYTNNVAAFARVRLRPRVLTGAGGRDLSTTVLGSPVSFPVLIGPAGGLAGMHPQGELAVARAAGAIGTLMAISTHAGFSLQEIVAAGDGPTWFQTFVFKDHSITEYLVEQARAAGCRALVLTVSNAGAPLWRQLRPGRVQAPAAVAPMLAGMDRADLLTTSALNATTDPEVSWKDVDRLRAIAGIPLVVKGIQTGEDARLCREHGAAGIVVSNHGGRFLQDARGTLDCLPEVVEAAGEGIEVYIDGGVRKGTDVLKALALGARAVLIGRPVFWGLRVAGGAGVEHVLELLRDELDASLGLCGVGDVRSLGPEFVDRGPRAAG